MPDKETVTLKLPSGENVDFIVPGGMSDSEVKTYVLSKRPDLFQQKSAEQPPSNAAMQAHQQLIKNSTELMNVSGYRELMNTKPAKNPSIEGTLGALPAVGGTIGATLGGIPGAALGGGAGEATQQLIRRAAGDVPVTSTSTKDIAVQAGLSAAGAGIGKYAISPVLKMIMNLGGKTAAAPLFQAVSDAAGDNPVDVRGPMAIAERARQLQQSGFRMPEVISKFLSRIEKSGEFLTFDEARDFEQAAGGRLSADEAMKIRPQMRAQLAQFADEMRKSTMQAAGNSGQANTFAEALQQHHAGALAQEKAEFTKAAMMELLKAAAKGAAIGSGAKAGYDIVSAASGGKK